MRRLLFMTVAVLVLAFSMAGLAYANGGPHGGYSATTDGCAGCHRAHTAIGDNLLTASSTFSLCMTCHGGAATGAQTNVSFGLYEAEAGTNIGTAMLGGQFDSTTSSHDMGETLAWTLPDFDGDQSALAGGATLSCASCHDPHGSTNYRMFPTTINGVAVAVTDFDAGSKDYTADSWAIGGTNNSISNMCEACHSGYMATGTNPGSSGLFTHKVEMDWNNADGSNATFRASGTPSLPLADNAAGSTTDTAAVCTTCHFPHGSDVTMNTAGTWGEAATKDELPSTGATIDDSSALLRVDGRGVCQDCHLKP